MTSEIRCPICGAETTIRASKKDGSKFHVCTNYPKCKGKVAFDEGLNDERVKEKPTANTITPSPQTPQKKNPRKGKF